MPSGQGGDWSVLVMVVMVVLMGFVCGLAAGVGLVRAAAALPDARLQAMTAPAALGLIIGSWMIALL